MKIAFATDDGKTISAHFGKAPYYAVVETLDGKMVAQEVRAKAHHGHDHEHGHGHDHADMFASIQDCQVLVAGGMGTPAYEAALARGLQVIVTDQHDITIAAQAYLSGTLPVDRQRIHLPGAH